MSANALPHQRRWPASLAVLVTTLLQLAVPDQVSLGPRWLLPSVQVALLVPLVATNPIHLRRDHPALRMAAAMLAACVLGFNAALLLRLVVSLSRGSTLSAQEILLTVTIILATNVIAAAVALWELDRGGPFARDPAHERPPSGRDVLFPQDGLTLEPHQRPWFPSFTDYLFVGFTMSTAFSPTDTMPVSARAKLLFMLGAAVAITSFAVVVARAANLL